MVVGTGLLGVGLSKIDNEAFVFFASGVSDSKTSDENEFKREICLLHKVLEENIEKCFVYFSTISIADESVSTNKYVMHKIEVEKYIERNAKKFLIIRTGNIVGGNGNTKTVFSFLVNNIINAIPFTLWEESYRNFLDIEDFVEMVNCVCYQLKIKNQIICLVNPNNIKITDLVSIIEDKFERKGVYVIEKKGSLFFVDKSLSNEIFSFLELPDQQYELKLIEKYF